MPSKSSAATAEETKVAIPNTAAALSRSARSRSAAKGAATVQRHKDQRRADSLAEMREQIADGTLVVRQMTKAERTGAPGAGRPTAAASEGDRS